MESKSISAHNILRPLLKIRASLVSFALAQQQQRILWQQKDPQV